MKVYNHRVDNIPKFSHCVSCRCDDLAEAAQNIEETLSEKLTSVGCYIPERYYVEFSVSGFPHYGKTYKHITASGSELILGNDNGQLFVFYNPLSHETIFK